MLTSLESSLEFLSSRWAPSLTPEEKKNDFQALSKCGNAPNEIGFKIVPKGYDWTMWFTLIIWLLRAWYVKGNIKWVIKKYVSFWLLTEVDKP